MTPDAMPPATAALTVCLEGPVLNALDRLAAQTEQSREGLVRRAVEDYIALNTWQAAKIRLGLDAAERGEFASDADMARLWDKYAPE